MINTNDTAIPAEITSPEASGLKAEATLTTIAETATPAITPLSGSWGEQKSRLKTQLSILTDAGLQDEIGKKDETFTETHAKLSKIKEELESIIAAL